MCGFRAGLSAFAAAVLLVVGAERPSKYHHTIEEGRVQVIESHQPVPLAVRPGGSVLEFGPLLFDGNVVQEHGKSHPDHWVVLFCPSWWEPCQAFVEIYQDQAEHWQLRLNNGLLNARTRFAVVDCAIHKVLCNEQAVEDYPTIVHYGRGVRVGQFTMNGKTDPDRFVAWLEAQLGHVPAAASQEAPAASSGTAATVAAVWRPFLAPGLSRDVAIIAVVLAANCWAFLSGTEPAAKEPRGAPPANAAVVAAEAQPGARRPVSRCLPADWTRQGESLVL
uniref:Thioredoxin domain-containing protein n=1 Tax=Alexandrium monilatum TaxID=311494 RepID=A0A7S4V0J4_9DINO|mmetsp:Transcript_25112/g.74947  ORF Transcript_25112/g.74947 Transcript_25112/m.74947 type:complete len:278 (+) Transcript_25112:92-925(+)